MHVFRSKVVPAQARDTHHTRAPRTRADADAFRIKVARLGCGFNELALRWAGVLVHVVVLHARDVLSRVPALVDVVAPRARTGALVLVVNFTALGGLSLRFAFPGVGVVVTVAWTLLATVWVGVEKATRRLIACARG